MNYCEKCKVAGNESPCPACGNKKLRQAEKNDFCFLAELEALQGKC